MAYPARSVSITRCPVHAGRPPAARTVGARHRGPATRAGLSAQFAVYGVDDLEGEGAGEVAGL